MSKEKRHIMSLFTVLILALTMLNSNITILAYHSSKIVSKSRNIVTKSLLSNSQDKSIRTTAIGSQSQSSNEFSLASEGLKTSETTISTLSKHEQSTASTSGAQQSVQSPHKASEEHTGRSYSMAPIQRTWACAPMMDYTDPHQHYFHRLLSHHSILYTEMVCATTLIHGEAERHLKGYLEYVPEKDRHKTVLQLGGACPDNMGQAAKIASSYGYSEININSGCPSDKVAGSGSFGATLMYKPLLVAQLAQSISHYTGRPATVKCRIGVDDQDSYEQLAEYIHIVHTHGGVEHFIVHARKAVLNANFSPADNRKIPPLKYDFVYRLVRDFPSLRFTLNGGVDTYEAINEHFANGAHGVMVGRSAVGAPFQWSAVDSKVYGVPDPGRTRRQVSYTY